MFYATGDIGIKYLGFFVQYFGLISFLEYYGQLDFYFLLPVILN